MSVVAERLIAPLESICAPQTWLSPVEVSSSHATFQALGVTLSPLPFDTEGRLLKFEVGLSVYNVSRAPLFWTGRAWMRCCVELTASCQTTRKWLAPAAVDGSPPTPGANFSPLSLPLMVNHELNVCVAG